MILISLHKMPLAGFSIEPCNKTIALFPLARGEDQFFLSVRTIMMKKMIPAAIAASSLQ